MLDVPKEFIQVLNQDNWMLVIQPIYFVAKWFGIFYVDSFLPPVQVVLCQINIVCHQLAQTTMIYAQNPIEFI